MTAAIWEAAIGHGYGALMTAIHWAADADGAGTMAGTLLGVVARGWTSIYAYAPLLASWTPPLALSTWTALRWWRQRPWFWQAVTVILTLVCVFAFAVPITAEYLKIMRLNEPRQRNTWRCDNVDESGLPDFIAICDQHRQFLKSPLGAAVLAVFDRQFVGLRAALGSTLMMIVFVVGAIWVFVGRYLAGVARATERRRLRNAAMDAAASPTTTKKVE